jgi:hypothetical protein
MTPQQTSPRQYKRLLAIAGATIVAAGATIGIAFASSAGESDAAPAKSVTTAPASPAPPLDTHYPTPAAPADSTREDGGPEEGTRGLSEPDAVCIDPTTGGHGPQHC